jgi:mannose-6-phosphate isomerase-like protein (cupin superfamily)
MAASPTPTAASSAAPGTLFAAGSARVRFQQRFTPGDAHLDWLSCGEYELRPGARTLELRMAEHESLLFQWKGFSVVTVEGGTCSLAPYDVLYIPRGARYQIANEYDHDARVVQTSAPAETVHPVVHARFAELSQREDRIRRLKGKDVYLMFDVAEGADKLVAGYTFFEPYARSWPPHNHTDQEECYFFLKGKGAMEVYESPETLSFVHSVSEGDIVTIPRLNYHPVFSQESPLEFIWCIAGARYWIGDKNKDFLSGTGPAITT